MSTVYEKAFLGNAHNNQLLRKWNSKINLVESKKGEPMDFARKLSLAKCLENTQYVTKSLNETTQQSDIGFYKRYAIDMVTALVPNLIAQDICSVQAMENRVGMVNYLSFEYGSDKAPATAGQQFADSFTYGPSVPEYTAQPVNGEVLQAATTNTLAWKPVIPGSVKITSGTNVIVDNGSGELAIGTTPAGSINYATGEITTTSALVADSTVNYKFTNEQAPTQFVPEMNMKVNSIPIEAKPRRLKALYAFEAGFEFQKEYGGNYSLVA